MDTTLSDVMHCIRGADDTETLWNETLEFFKARGVKKMSYHLYRGTSEQGGKSTPSDGVWVMSEGFPDDWVCQYIRQKLYRVDPIPELARTATTPFFWEDIESYMKLSADQRDYMKHQRAAHIGDGLAIPVFGPDMRNAFVGLGFGETRPDLTDLQVAELQCAAQMAHLRRCELDAEDDHTRFDLSPREREILHWIARGKSNAAIAGILNISPHTVDTLTRRLFDKLGVKDRTSAAIRGVGSGLVLPA